MDWTRRQLQTIVAIAERRNISHAAVELSLTQPTVSRMLSRIETSLGTRLFHRDVNGAVPTEAGVLLIERAQEVLRSLDMVADEIRSLDGRLVGKACVAMPDTTGHTLFIPLIDRFGSSHPDVELRVMASHPNGVPLALASGDADVGIISSAHKHAGVTARLMASEHLHLVGSPRRLPNGSSDVITLADVAEKPLVLPAIQPGLRSLIDAAFAQKQLRPNVVLEVDAEDALVELVSSGRVLSIMSFAGVHRLVGRGDLWARRIVDPSIERVLSTAVSTSRPTTRLMLAVQEAVHELAVDLAPEARWKPL